MTKIPALLTLAAWCLSAQLAAASQVPFDQAWKEQGFFRFWTNDYSLRGRQLDVVSNGTVSLVWRPVEGELRAATNAMWRWRVTEGVPPTNLTEKGGDDRNLALYFVFVDEESARVFGLRKSCRALLLVNRAALS
ncbi:MAG: DUF3047 domain-containing protein, partial [Pseudomonadota bacterium]